MRKQPNTTSKTVSHGLADPHNFGQVVERIRSRGEVFYRKPRPIFWEYLFFGKDSPLKKFFDRPLELDGERGKSFSDLFFQLEFRTSVRSVSSGEVNEVIDLKSDELVSNLEKYSFGALVGYCYVFGIHDIHMDNLRRVETGLLPVDIETVFMDFKLPCESLLYPMPEARHDNYGLKKLFGRVGGLDTETVHLMIRGFVDLLRVVSGNSVELGSELENLVKEIRSIPVRVILRATRDYVDWIESGKPDDVELVEEELIQMGRKDVPYFFKYLGDEKLYYYSEKDQKSSVSEVHGLYKSICDRVGVSVPYLLSEKRLTKVLLTGVLHLAKRFLESEEELGLPLNGGALALEKDSIVLSIGGISARSKR